MNKNIEGVKTTIVVDEKKVEGIYIPLDPRYEEKMKGASFPKKIYKKIIMHG